MSKDYKKEIESLLIQIEVATGMNQGEISRHMGYASNYLSTAMGRGGNKKLIEKIKQKYAAVLDGIKILSKPDKYEQALLKTLLTDYIKFKSQMTNKSVEDIADEIDENTKLTLRDLNKI